MSTQPDSERVIQEGREYLISAIEPSIDEVIYNMLERGGLNASGVLAQLTEALTDRVYAVARLAEIDDEITAEWKLDPKALGDEVINNARFTTQIIARMKELGAFPTAAHLQGAIEAFVRRAIDAGLSDKKVLFGVEIFYFSLDQYYEEPLIELGWFLDEGKIDRAKVMALIETQRGTQPPATT